MAEKSQLSPSSVLRFGVFQVNLAALELRKHGVRIRLAGQPFCILSMLLERPGEIVTREQLRARLWPANTFVDFEHSLNTAVKKLRVALGDSPEKALYVETLPRIGYRFIAPVEQPNPAPTEVSWVVGQGKIPSLATAGSSGRLVSRHALLGIVALIVTAGVGTVWWFAHRWEPRHQLKQRRLTANPPDLAVTSAAISPDGKYLGYSDQQGLHLQLVDSGQTQTVPWPSGTQADHAFWDFESWYPDSTRFIARLAVPGRPIRLWSVPILEGTPQELIGDVYGGSGISPNGSYIAFLKTPAFLENNIGDPYILGAREIWLMGPHGESPHKIIAAEDLSGFERISWSPAGNRIAYKHWRQQGDNAQVSVESSDLNGANKTTILSNNYLEDFVWTSSGRFVYSQDSEGYSSDYNADNLWELRVDPTTGTPQGAPRRLTDWSGFSATDLRATADGKHLQFLRGTHHHSVFVGELKNGGSHVANARRLTTDDHSNVPFAWTPDSRRVIFLSRRTQVLQVYSQALAQNTAPQLVTPAPTIDFSNVRVAPDGESLIALGQPRGSSKENFYRVVIGGGVPQLLFVPESGADGDFRCTNERANFCVYALHTPDQKELIIKSFDLMSGKGNEMLRIPVDPAVDHHWALSPDGSQVGILKSEWDSNQIRFFHLRGPTNRSISVNGYDQLRSLDWAPDSRSVFVGTSGPGGATLLRVTLDGSVLPIWQQPQPLNTWGIPSPDGHHIAIFGSSSEANVWMIDNF